MSMGHLCLSLPSKARFLRKRAVMGFVTKLTPCLTALLAIWSNRLWDAPSLSNKITCRDVQTASFPKSPLLDNPGRCAADQLRTQKEHQEGTRPHLHRGGVDVSCLFNDVSHLGSSF